MELLFVVFVATMRLEQDVKYITSLLLENRVCAQRTSGTISSELILGK